MKTHKILIVGTGAIGSFYGALLAKSGAEVSVVCRSDYDFVSQHGFSITSQELGNWHFQPARILASIEDYQDQADFVIVCTKITEQIDLPALIHPAISPATAIVFIQNGVEIESLFTDAFPDHEIISGLAFICCNRTAPGEILHLAYGRLVLGNVPDGISAKTTLLADLINRTGIKCQTSNAIITARWQKCVWNAPFNPLSVLSGGLLTNVILATQESLVRSIMREICLIAAATGHPLPDNIIETNIQNTRVMPPYKTSMLLDFDNGRTMETEAILGNAVRAASREGVACPHLETVYALMKLRELQLSG